MFSGCQGQAKPLESGPVWLRPWEHPIVQLCPVPTKPGTKRLPRALALWGAWVSGGLFSSVWEISCTWVKEHEGDPER